MTKPIAGCSIGAAALVTLFSCSERTIEFVRTPPEPTGESSFSGGDASTVEAGELIAYCPSTRCTNNTATCTGSLFPCDVDLMTDEDNCGACGIQCPGATGQTSFDCQGGRCVFTCQAGWLDCNAFAEDGCETMLGTNANCNSCGDVCADPAKPCLEMAGNKFRCGCPDGLMLCGRSCVDPMSADRNCAACGTICDPAGGGQPTVANAYYGCLAGTCGHLKCESGFADCDNDLATGCETATTTDDDCGGCGIACSPGQRCVKVDNKMLCLCNAGETLCGKDCVDLLSNSANCGACGVSCFGAVGNAQGAGHGIGYCAYGSCAFDCTVGWADCNGDPSDNCEVNVSSDPNNCGGCGITCQADQPCIGGQCAVEPCDEIGRVPQ